MWPLTVLPLAAHSPLEGATLASLCFKDGPVLLISLDEWLDVIDRRLGTPASERDPGPLRKLGPPQRQLRALLWKHGVADYASPGLNSFELLERLQQIIARRRVQGEKQH